MKKSLTSLFKLNHHVDDGGMEKGPVEDSLLGRSSFPSPSDLFRYRKQRGVNLGSWFVLERWITEAPFRFAQEPAQSDLDVARGSYAKQVLERHWDTWITESDWERIARVGINTVRIPIGYYHICGIDPTVIRKTDFADYFHVFEGAWERIVNAVATASRYGIGVLIDLHAAPGKQNHDAHSGTSANDPQFFTRSNMKQTTEILITLVRQLTRITESSAPFLSNLVGIELLNEPQPGSNHAVLEQWYIETSRAIRQVNPHIPIFIGDSWSTDHYASFVERQSSHSALPFLVLDHHLYRCFTDSDTNTTVQQHVSNLSDPNSNTVQMLARVSQKLSAPSVGGALVIGEWSGALNPGSLHGIENEIEHRRDFVKAQLALYEAHCAGWFFWTYKKESTGDKGWSLLDAVSAGVFPLVVGLRCGSYVSNKDRERSLRKQSASNQALGQHIGYWSQYPGNYEHWRFDDGFAVGWDDAWLFFDSVADLPPRSPVPELGFKGPWLRRRLEQHVQEKGGGKGLWEFEHGFSQGLIAGYNDLQTQLGMRR